MSWNVKIGWPKKGDSKEKCLSDHKWYAAINSLAWILSQFIPENTNTAMEYTSTVVSNTNTLCNSSVFNALHESFHQVKLGSEKGYI